MLQYGLSQENSFSPVCTKVDTSQLSLLLLCSFRLLSSIWAALSCSLVLWYCEVCVSSFFFTSISWIYVAKDRQREANDQQFQMVEIRASESKRDVALTFWLRASRCFCSTSFSSLFRSWVISRSCFSIWEVSRRLVSVSERFRVAWTIHLQKHYVIKMSFVRFRLFIS